MVNLRPARTDEMARYARDGSLPKGVYVSASGMPIGRCVRCGAMFFVKRGLCPTCGFGPQRVA